MAHTTHFTTPHTSWLLGGSGSGSFGGDAVTPLGNGGFNTSYVAYATGSDVTIVVESFLAGGQWHDRSGGEVPAPVTGTFALTGAFARFAGGALHAWHTNASVTFERLPDVSVAADGTFSATVEAGAIYTFTSVASAHPGAAAWLAESAAAGSCAPSGSDADAAVSVPDAPFPLPWHDDFEGYANDTLPLFTGDMFGAFTVYELPAAAAAGSPLPLRQREGISSRDVACGDDAAVAARPRRCVPAVGARGNTRVLRQWTRAPPIGWGGGSSNMATILGSPALANVTLAVRALIETPDAGYEPANAPYVLVGIHGGGGPGTVTSPRAFYRQGPDCDFAWFSASQWGCSIAGVPECQTAHPIAFGLDAWHAISLGSTPRADGGANMTLTLDGATLFHACVAAVDVKNKGAGGYAVLVTGAHRAMFDDVSLTSTV